MTQLDKFTFAALELTLPLVLAAWFTAYSTRFYGVRDTSDPCRCELHNAIFLLLGLVAASRAFVGLAKYWFGKNLWYVSFLYPIRVGGINWGLLQGLPYVIPCLLVLWRLDLVLDWIGRRRNAGGYLFLFALLFGMSFGAIQGGLQYGLTDFFYSPTHIHDAELFNWTFADLLSHDYRRYSEHEPHYLATHFRTHPPFVLAIWSFFFHKLSMDWFSVFCTLIFAGMIYCVYRGFRKEFGKEEALTLAVLFLFTPALLIYGIGGDDVISYALWTVTLCFAYSGIRRESFFLFGVALVALVLAMAVQYSSILLLPAMFALPAEATLPELPQYIWRFKYWILASASVVVMAWGAVYYASGFNYVSDVRDIFVWYRQYNFSYKIAHGEYAYAIGSRLMNIFDFLLLGGPVVVFAICKKVSAVRWRPAQWMVRDVALTILFIYVIFQSMGDGETARGWGGLYAVLLFGMIARFFSQYSLDVQRRIMRYQLGWALALQIPINFGW
jgi:hypothetical protein